jgi:hypothetical protein
MEEKLKELIGNKYLYQGKEITIEKVKKINASFVIITNKRTFNFYEAEAHKFMQDIQQVNAFKNLPKMESNTEVITKSEDKLQQVIFDAIAQVKNNKEYVQQANAICNLTSQLINIKKLELQIMSKKNS